METISAASSALVISHNRQDEEAIAISGCIERRQQILLRENIIVDGAGVVEQLRQALQTSQTRTDEKLLEVAQFAHDHVISTAADTEQRLQSRISEYFDDVQAHFEATNKFQIDVQAAEINKRLVDVVQDVHGRIDTTMKAAFESFAADLGQKVNATLTTMEGTINEHKKTHASECERRLDAALKSCQDTFEAATDLQAEWIERRFNAKLKAAVEAESKQHQLTLQAHLAKQEQKLHEQTAKLAQKHADSIEVRLQQKLDSAMTVAHQQALSEIEECFGDMTNKLKCDELALKEVMHGDIQANMTKLETKFQSQLRGFQTASSTSNNKMKHQIAQLNAVVDRLNTRLSTVENQSAARSGFPFRNSDADDLTNKGLNPITSVLAAPIISSAPVGSQVAEIASSPQEGQHFSGRQEDGNSGSGDTAILTALNQINMGKSPSSQATATNSHANTRTQHG